MLAVTLTCRYVAVQRAQVLAVTEELRAARLEQFFSSNFLLAVTRVT